MASTPGPHRGKVVERGNGDLGLRWERIEGGAVTFADEITLAARLTGKSAAETISAMLAVFGRIDPHLRRSITFDNDTAFAQHALLRTMRAI